jgi:predicted DNA-binding transcriptional regulator YafY
LAVHSGRSQVIRLLQLILALQSNQYPNARRLAELCGVSRRTIYRDLDTLEAAGIPVSYEPERQGYRLEPGFMFHPPELDEKEARSLLVLAHLGGPDDALGLRRHARSAAWKAIHGLDSEARSRALALAEMVHSRDVEMELPPHRRSLYETVLEALANRRQIRVWVLDEDGTTVTFTKVSPYRLVLDGPLWYLIGRSSFHRCVHVFRLPRIRRVELTNEAYTIPIRFNLARFLGGAWLVERGPAPVEVVLQFSKRLAPEIQEQMCHPSQRITMLENGRLELQLRLEGIQEVKGWILGFGDQVEVVSPPELRDQVRDQALRIAQMHAASAPTSEGPRSTASH